LVVRLGRIRQNRTVEIGDTLGFLLGTWQVTRSIDDHPSGTFASFTGIAAVAATVETVPAANAGPARRARYDETGELRIGTYTGPARRSLEYLRLEDGTAKVSFSDGRPFITIDLSRGAWKSTHLCGEDRYDIALLVRSPDVVEEHWRVQGPTKRYDAVTTLVRLGGQSAGSRR
jgi:hypothetical protein